MQSSIFLTAKICWEENFFQEGVGSTVFSQTTEKVEASLSLALYGFLVFVYFLYSNAK